MRYLAALVTIVALMGCDREAESFKGETGIGAADSSAVQSPHPSKSDTLKVTFSKSDPLDTSTDAPKSATPHSRTVENAGHGSKEKSAHEEHSKK
ncbi:hypothetical protein QQ056_11325 [Oscillatoria laete-virens NRMC-F 0139]|nr:hypothetical protein [Oscillatoria laete-virens]MDL5054132.1 hypothetical protein [Oscillatoria laete-virens NRMC-F 0139]